MYRPTIVFCNIIIQQRDIGNDNYTIGAYVGPRPRPNL